MDFIGIDLHKTSSQVCILSEDGELTERHIKSTRTSFNQLFAARPRARILVEASTESEWVACHLEELGHEVIVADPNFAPMYATRDKKTKTDKRDTRALCEACRLGAYRPAHRTSERQRKIRAQLLIRSTLVRTRTKYISLIGALACREGCLIATGGSNNRARTLLIEAAWALLRWWTDKNKALHDWAMRIAARRGRARACVALARKLAGIPYAMWLDESEFDPQALRYSDAADAA